jgi:uncharacterized protein
MLLEELDGFIAGLLTCPELIMPGDWLPLVWHEDSAGQQPVFEDLDHANRVLGLVMEHYNNVALTLMERPDHYSPLFSVDTRNGVSFGSCGSTASSRPWRCARQPGESFSTPMSIRRRR